MTHPHGLTRQDVAHLKAGDEVTAVLTSFDDQIFRVTSTLMVHPSNPRVLRLAGWNVVYDNEPLDVVVEVISPKPPVPPMAEPTWLGAVVMNHGSPMVRCHQCDSPWTDDEGDWYGWSEISNPRPLTPAERRDLGIPETLPDGWVAVDAGDVPANLLAEWGEFDPETATSDAGQGSPPASPVPSSHDGRRRNERG